ncbi:MAG: hypothetical protein QOF04_1707 [Solirubrobacteraceae bacterium]|nr:hypothetical protein [Solirubrobacteraceae bacterium]
MRAPLRLLAFAAALATVFATAALAGSRIDVHPGERAGATAGEPGMAGMAATGADAHGEGATSAPKAVRGLAVSDNGLTLALARTTATSGRRLDLRFRIVDRRGATVRDFDVEHTKRMHLIVVRRDMTAFQHLHPTQRPAGAWSVPVTLRDAGSYRVLADFSTGGTAHTLADDLTVDGTVRSQPLPAPVQSVDVDGLRVSLTEGASTAGAESQMRFTVTRAGRPVAVEPYLGAKGHLVALRQGDLAFLHVHPDEDSLRFMAAFPSAGRYRLFLQFQTEGRVHTAAFTQEVSR